MVPPHFAAALELGLRPWLPDNGGGPAELNRHGCRSSPRSGVSSPGSLVRHPTTGGSLGSRFLPDTRLRQRFGWESYQYDFVLVIERMFDDAVVTGPRSSPNPLNTATNPYLVRLSILRV